MGYIETLVPCRYTVDTGYEHTNVAIYIRRFFSHIKQNIIVFGEMASANSQTHTDLAVNTNNKQLWIIVCIIVCGFSYANIWKSSGTIENKDNLLAHNSRHI